MSDFQTYSNHETPITESAARNAAKVAARSAPGLRVGTALKWMGAAVAVAAIVSQVL